MIVLKVNFILDLNKQLIINLESIYNYKIMPLPPKSFSMQPINNPPFVPGINRCITFSDSNSFSSYSQSVHPDFKWDINNFLCVNSYVKLGDNTYQPQQGVDEGLLRYSSGNVSVWTGTAWESLATSGGLNPPGNPPNSIQFNDNGTFGGSSNLIYADNTATITLSRGSGSLKIIGDYNGPRTPSLIPSMVSSGGLPAPHGNLGGLDPDTNIASWWSQTHTEYLLGPPDNAANKDLYIKTAATSADLIIDNFSSMRPSSGDVISLGTSANNWDNIHSQGSLLLYSNQINGIDLGVVSSTSKLILGKNSTHGIITINNSQPSPEQTVIQLDTTNNNSGRLRLFNRINSTATPIGIDLIARDGSGISTLEMYDGNTVNIKLDGSGTIASKNINNSVKITSADIETDNLTINNTLTGVNLTATSTLKGKDIVAEGSSGTIQVKDASSDTVLDVQGSSTTTVLTVNKSTVPQVRIGTETGQSSISMGGTSSSNPLIKLIAGTTSVNGQAMLKVPLLPWKASSNSLNSGLITNSIGISDQNDQIMYKDNSSKVHTVATGVECNSTHIASSSFDILCNGVTAQSNSAYNSSKGSFILIGEVKNNNGDSFANIAAMGPLTFPTIGLTGNISGSTSYSPFKQYLKITSQFFTTPSNQFGGLYLWARYILYRKANGNPSNPLPEPEDPGDSGNVITAGTSSSSNCPTLSAGDQWYVLQSDPLPGNTGSGSSTLPTGSFASVTNYKGVRLQRTDSGRAFTFTQYCTAPFNLTTTNSTQHPTLLDNWYLILQVRDNYSTGTRSWILPQGANIYWTSLGGLSTTTGYGGPVNMSIEVINSDSQVQTNISVP